MTAPLRRVSGAVVWRPSATGIEVLLVHRVGHDDWALPKGKPEGDELLEQTALREAMEETGVNLRLGVFAGRYRYYVKDKLKVVDMWHMVRLPGGYPHRASAQEIDDVAWLTPLDAMQRLTHQVEREFVGAHIGDAD